MYKLVIGDREKIKLEVIKGNLSSKLIDYETYVKKALPDIQKAYSGATSTDVADSIPTITADWFIDQLTFNNKLRQIVQVYRMPNKTVDIPKITGGLKVFIQGEGYDIRTESGLDQASSGYTKPTMSKITLTAKKFSGITGWTSESEEDSVLNLPQLFLNKLAKAMADFEELAMIQGDENNALGLTGTVGGSYDNFPLTAGDVRYAFDGLIAIAPGSSPGWTPKDPSPSNIIDGGSDALTYDEMNQLFSVIEESAAKLTDIFIRPKVHARLRNDAEFEAFLTVDKIGQDRAANIKGFVGKYYDANVFVTDKVPVGTAFGTNSDDTLVIGFDRNELIIGDRRIVSFNKQHEFYRDVIEIRVDERIDFKALHNEGVALIADVKDTI